MSNPPTPTIESILDKLEASFMELNVVQVEAFADAQAELALLITKATEAAYKRGVSDTAEAFEKQLESRLKATTQPSYSPAPGTDGEA